ncbi:A24 family peptidase [Hydrogenoanaerobacterium sp.]|uniref:A24 family peptidase n=1 Tax=Hydrogenoanaerobacterium sp. TaxID=2953763 RepID=UPI00289A177E|nr:A24 family peptidase [Hydrogenoanaerobacterium sp.]
MPDKLAVLHAVFFVALLCAASVVDLKHRIIPDWLNLMIAAISLLCFSPEQLLGILIALPFLLAAVFFGGMGGGDIKLMAACGLVLGLPKGLFAAMAGLSLQLLYVAIYRIVCKVQRREAKKAFPLAPFLSTGCLFAYFI